MSAFETTHQKVINFTFSSDAGAIWIVDQTETLSFSKQECNSTRVNAPRVILFRSFYDYICTSASVGNLHTRYITRIKLCRFREMLHCSFNILRHTCHISDESIRRPSAFSFVAPAPINMYAADKANGWIWHSFFFHYQRLISTDSTD